MQAIPIGNFGNQVNPLLAQNQAMGVPLGNVKTLAPQQGRLVDLGKSPAMLDAQFNQQIYRDDRLEQNALNREQISHSNALDRLSVENDFRMDQLRQGNEYQLGQMDKKIAQENTMFGITKEHQLAMEGLRKSTNLEVQSQANLFQENMAQITRDFQIEREELGFEKAKEQYKQRRRQAMDDFRQRLIEQGQFDDAKRFWDSLADEKKIDYQLTQEEAAFKRRQSLISADRDAIYKREVEDASGMRANAEQAYRERDDWVNQGGALSWMQTEYENTSRELFGDLGPQTPQDKQKLNALVLGAYRREEERRNANAKFYGEAKIPGGFDPNALTPGSTIKRQLTPSQLRAAHQRLLQLRASKQQP